LSADSARSVMICRQVSTSSSDRLLNQEGAMPGAVPSSPNRHILPALKLRRARFPARFCDHFTDPQRSGRCSKDAALLRSCDFAQEIRREARPAGLEPATPGLEGEIPVIEPLHHQQLTPGAMPRCHADSPARVTPRSTNDAASIRTDCGGLDDLIRAVAPRASA
jgi:hypothetical protein